MRLEAAFFGAQPGVPPPPPLGILVADFDETCTVADTTGAIMDAAIAAAEQRANGVTSFQSLKAVFRSSGFFDSAKAKGRFLSWNSFA